MSVFSKLNEKSIEIHEKRRSTIPVNIRETLKAKFYGGSRNKYIFKQFIKSLNPIDSKKWNESNLICKIFMAIKVK